jgi:transmembrane sensor
MDEQLIRRFLEKNCTEQEAEQVISFLKQHPELLEKYLGFEEWQMAKPVDKETAFWDGVWQQIELRKAKRKHAIIRRLAVAASLIFAISVGVLWLGRKAEAPAVAAVESSSIESARRVRMNVSDSTISIILPDNSSVLLSPRSMVTYDEPFPNDKRHIVLEGKGRFRVTKDSLRPFTVFAEDIATTAIGTEFTVNAIRNQDHTVTVQLHSGKVVVKQTGQKLTWNKEVYLQPGQQLNYNLGNLQASISTIKSEPAVVASKLPRVARKARAIAPDNTMNFISAPLPEVLAKIEKRFHSQISFDSVALSKMNFTGKISERDSIAVVLKVITQMNGLELITENEKFTIVNPASDKP